jgi:purine nucleosidase
MNARPVLIDCDPGVDDALALMLAAASPELDLIGVTCVAGNRPLATTTHNARRVLDLAGRVDLAVYAGCSRPLARGEPRCNLVHGEDGLSGLPLPAGRPASAVHALDFLERSLLERAPGELTVVAIGPLTHLALAEVKHPGLLRRARSVAVMGGAAFCAGNVTPSAEYNFHADALAAHTVLGSGADIHLFGLDVTRQAQVSAAWMASLSALGNRCGAAAQAMLQAFSRPEPCLHDTCPVAWLLAPEWFEFERCTVEVDWRPGLTEGHLAARRLVKQEAASHSIALATAVQSAALRGLLMERLSRLP